MCILCISLRFAYYEMMTQGSDREIHISGDIALAAWNYYTHGPSSDHEWLSTVGFPLLKGVCEFYMSKIAIDNPGAAAGSPLYMLGVVGPDEYLLRHIILDSAIV